MKRKSAFFAVALLFGFVVAACQVGAQVPAEKSAGLRAIVADSDSLNADSDPSQLDALEAQYQKASQRAAEAAVEFLKQRQRSKTDPGAEGIDLQTLREKLRPLVEASFDARQRSQRAELREMVRRLAEIERAIHERERKKERIVNSRIESLLDAATMMREPQNARDDFQGVAEEGKGEGQTISVSGGQEAIPRNEDRPATAPNRVYERPLPDLGETTEDRRETVLGSASLDLETRERLAQLDVDETEAELAAAVKELDALQSARFGVSGRALQESVRKKRKAEYELKRARLKLEGLARQRAELQTAADAEIAEAEAEVIRVEAKVDVAKADVIAAEAQLERSKAELEGAAAAAAHRRKVFERLHQLATVQKAVDIKLVDEADEKKLAALAALASAKSAIETGEAHVVQAKAAIEEVLAELNVAKERLRAAKARRDRLKQGSSPDPVDTIPSDPSKREEKVPR